MAGPLIFNCRIFIEAISLANDEIRISSSEPGPESVTLKY